MINNWEIGRATIKVLIAKPCLEFNAMYQATVKTLVSLGMSEDEAKNEVLAVICDIDKKQKSQWERDGVPYV